MFTTAELAVLLKALSGMSKSLMRLAAKDEQPDSVAAEYRRVGSVVADLFRKVRVEYDKASAVVKK